MESGADLQQAADSSPDVYVAIRRLGDAGQHLQQGAFARTVASDDTNDFALADIERNIIKSPNVTAVLSVSPAGARKRGAYAPKRRCHHLGNLIAKRGMPLLGISNLVLLGKTSGGNYDLTHRLAFRRHAGSLWQCTYLSGNEVRMSICNRLYSSSSH